MRKENKKEIFGFLPYFFSFPFFSLFTSSLRRAHFLNVLEFLRPFFLRISLFGQSATPPFFLLLLALTQKMFEPIAVRPTFRVFLLLLSLVSLQLFLFHALTSTFDVGEGPSIVGDLSQAEYPTKFIKKYETQFFLRRAAMDRDRYRACKDAGRACK